MVAFLRSLIIMKSPLWVSGARPVRSLGESFYHGSALSLHAGARAEDVNNSTGNLTLGSLISPADAIPHLNNPHLKFLDGSWYMDQKTRQPSPYQAFLSCRIPNSNYFDIGKSCRRDIRR